MSQHVLEEPRLVTDFRDEKPVEARSIYYGWIMLPMSMAVVIASSPGQTFGVSVFNEPMRHALGLSHGQLAAAYMLGTLLGAIPLTFIGGQMDRHGLRRTMLVAVSLFCLACMFTSTVQGWLTLTIGFCFLRMLGPGALSFLSSNTLSFWFERRLGMVEGVRQLGMATAMGLVPMLNLWLVSNWGWRSAYGILGVGIWVLLFPSVLLLFRNHPGELGQQIDGKKTIESESPAKHALAESYWGLTLKQTLRTSSFWIVTGGTALFSLIHTGVFFCLVPILQERGLSENDAAITLTTFAIFLGVTQLPAGMLADRIQARFQLFAGMLGLSTGITLLLVSETREMAFASGAVLGMSQALFFGASHPLWARYFGRRHLGKIRGVLTTINVACSSLGPLMAGLTRDWLGSFDVAMILFAVSPLLVAALSLLVIPPQREPSSEILNLATPAPVVTLKRSPKTNLYPHQKHTP